MSKILNWTFGACFRTLGRFLAIFIVGVLLIFIGSKIGLELPDWLALSVNASMTPGWASTLPSPQNIAYYSCSSATQCSLQSNDIDYFESVQTLRPFVINPNAWIIGANGYVIGSPVTTMKPGYLYNVNFYLCANVNVEPNFDLYSSEFENFSNGNVYSITRRSTISNVPVIDGGRTFSYCHVYSALIVPEDYHNWAYIRLKRQTTNISNVYMSTVAVETKEMGIYTDTIKNIIDNSGYATAESVDQVQQSVNKVEEEIQQTQDTITNDDTSGAQGSANGFFNDFKSEDFGLSSIVTAPLRGINAMLTDTCIAPSATYKGQTFSLPCGSMLWSRPGGDDFKSFINVMYGGFLAYLVIRKFFLDVETLKNPNSDKVEVDKL